MDKVRSDIGINWTDNEVDFLIDLWEESFPEMKSYGRNSKLYQRLAEKINQEFPTCFKKDRTHVFEKITNLKKQYLNNKKKKEKNSGAAPIRWRYFQRLERFLLNSALHDQSHQHGSMENLQKTTNTVNPQESVSDVEDLVDLEALPCLNPSPSLTLIVEDARSISPIVSCSTNSEATRSNSCKRLEKKKSIAIDERAQILKLMTLKQEKQLQLLEERENSRKRRREDKERSTNLSNTLLSKIDSLHLELQRSKYALGRAEGKISCLQKEIELKDQFHKKEIEYKDDLIQLLKDKISVN